MNTLYRHAKILTADSKWNYFLDGGILVSDGKIAWIGNIADWSSSNISEPYSEIDLSGFTIIPGLINTHAHGGLSLFRGLCDDGNLFQWASAIAPTTSTVDEETLRFGCHLAIMEQISCGITCTCDCTRYGTGIFANAAENLGLRSISGTLVNSVELRKQGKPNWPSALIETERSMKEFQGSSKTRFFLGAHSIYSCTPEMIKEVKRQADNLLIPFDIHVSETTKEVEDCLKNNGKRPVAFLDDLGVLDSNVLIAHGVWLDEDELEIIKSNQVSIAHCPISNAKLGSGIAPIPEMLENQVVVGLGTDSTMSNNAQDLFAEMKFAVLLQRAHHGNGSLLSARDVIKMATIDGAKALGWDSEIGSLEIGKKADFIVLKLPEPEEKSVRKIESDIVYSGGSRFVHQVVIEGEAVYENGRFTLLDQNQLIDEMNKLSLWRIVNE